MMAEYLSFRRNQAYAYSTRHPDENFAREIQQLFSIGLWQLNDDGTQVKDPVTGENKPTYTNDDIQSQARVWTGHEFQPLRSNIEREDQSSSNYVDPMQLRPVWRDPLPKMNLYGGHIGDGYPLCENLPKRHWLKPGARFVYTGSSSDEGDEVDAQAINGWNLFPRLQPAVDSPLHAALCASDGTKCTFPSEVVLTSELSCSGNANSQECRADRIVVVKVLDVANPTDNSTARYYTYKPLPCVELTFFNNGVGKTLKRTWYHSCGNPELPLGVPSCCSDFGRGRRQDGVGCLFGNERMTITTAEERCSMLNQTIGGNVALCNTDWRVGWSSVENSCTRRGFQWLANDCLIQVQVLAVTGRVGVVDELGARYWAGNIWRKNGANTFRVNWEGGRFPSPPNCAAAGCDYLNAGSAETCVCNITRTTYERVYSSGDALPPNKEAFDLHIGAAYRPSPPEYVAVLTRPSDNVVVWAPSSEVTSASWSTNVVFEVPPFRKGGRTRYLLNSRSMVHVGPPGSGFVFRNPPHFMPLFGKYSRQFEAWNSDKLWLESSEQEVEALLDHLFEHNSTAPFVCYRLAQNMITSNPSPRYMRSMVNAFRTGEYNGRVYSGKYGDMAATVAAMLLDPEARSPYADVIPTHGMLRDPLIKLLGVMRTLGYRSTWGQEVYFDDLLEKIGVSAFQSPSVFGFYKPEFRPAGVLSDKGLVAPQAQIIDGPNLIFWLNGMYSLVDFGLTSCSGGFGSGFFPIGRYCNRNQIDRARARSEGQLTYQPPANSTANEIVDELDLLLTGRRLSNSSRDILLFDYMQQKSVSRLIKLLLLSAEFHVTNFPQPNPSRPRSISSEVPSQGRRPKYIIVVYKSGGLDSFNMLVPRGGCTNNDLYNEYSTVRGPDIALSQAELLGINVPTGTQPCTAFGVHPSMPRLTQMYQQQEALFVANIGGLVQPMTLEDYYGTSPEAASIRTPPSLFSHNGMTQTAHNGDALNNSATGILGRIARSMQTQGYRTEVISVAGNQKFLEGSLTPYTALNPRSGAVPFYDYSQVQSVLGNLTKQAFESSLAETYQSSALRSIGKLETLSQRLSSVTLNTTFEPTARNRLADQLRMISRLIKLRQQLGTERGVFYAQDGGYDTHNNYDLSSLLGGVDEALGLFKEEMVAQGMWDDVVIVQSSEFGRTLVGNGQGTDHAWGGNIWVAGGSVEGGKILGQYPRSLMPEVDVVFNSRGRVIPTRGWEAVWKGVAEWFGVTPEQMPEVLPNLRNFPPSDIFNRGDMFKN
mmetsp:Transcript_6632/g.16185  ORF Transcript_6632/g.16185 Transcript_6632/m.16185 type:complete len:1268 (+) Transcript_6632:1-3804(+)